MLSSMNTSNSFWDDVLGRRSLMSWGQPLQLQRRGDFFNDSLFHDIRCHFDSAVKDVVKSFDFKRDNDFASYRLLRDRQLTGMDRASSLTEEQHKFKIVMDVHGFIENDLKVTYLNDNELIVEGQIEKKDEVSLARQSFKRRFVLPGKINVNETTSALSSDNILTIVIPKQLQTIAASEVKTLAQGDIASQTQTQTANLSLDNKQTIQQEQQTQSKKESSIESTLQNFSGLSKNFGELSLQNFPELPIVQKKDFFGDSFFDNVRGQFQSRVKEIMDRTFERTNMEDFNIYKKFREKDEKESNVAVTVSGDSKEHKIVLDAHGFSEGDLKVKAVSANQLIVEGKVEKRTGNSYCNNSFRRSFYLPDVANIKETTSALSSDGVLTISVPKLDKPLPIEYSIPITREEQERKTSKSRDVTSRTAIETTSKEHIVPIALGYKDDYMANIQEEKKDATQFQSSPIPPTASPLPPVQTQIQAQTQVQAQSQTHTQAQTQAQNGARMIPISLAGSFFQDSIFDTAKKKVESAVKDAMSRSSSVCSQQQDTSVSQQEVSTQHREVSSQKQENLSQKQSISTQQQVSNQEISQEKEISSTFLDKQAAPKPLVSTTLADDANFYKINLDVYGYSENELKIKTYPNNEIYIEGVSERKKEGSISKQSFQKRFQLPDYVVVSQASSALSSEGMLTITMPKKQVQPLPPSERMIPVSLERTQTPPIKDIASPDIETASTISDVSSISTAIGSQSTQSEYSVPHASETQKHEANQSSIIQRRDDFFKDSFFDNDFFKDFSTKINCDLPIARRGHFYQDSFFNDSRDMFESALKGSMDRFRNFSSFSDDMNFYKSLRDQRVAAETTTEASAEDQQYHKILLDVQGYSENDLKIQVLEGNCISVEGKVEERGHGSLSTRNFKKCFFLPIGFNANKATTGLSADSVLTIKVPRDNKQAIAF